jgi:hypothetical protein
MQQASPTQLLVRHARTQKFLQSSGRWTRKAEAAFNFPNTVNAIHTSLASGAKEVELILRFEGRSEDVRLSLRCA